MIFYLTIKKAPFGVPRDTIDILGEFVASNDIKSIYRNWEDSLSRKLYVLSGISDDRVAASIQLYIEEKRDSEVKLNLSAAIEFYYWYR